MSASQPSTLPRLSGDDVATFSHSRVCNINEGSGSQHNATQADGHGNSQYNASQQHFHHYEHPRSQPKHLRRVPRQAAGHYAGYSDISAKLEACLLKQPPKDEQIVCVLSGMGGVGKSESVLQFLKRQDTALRESFWAVLWVDCSSEATAQAEFKSIGSLCGWAPDESDLLRGVKDQLASLEKMALLILDNCDDTKTNFNRYIPNSVRISVVLTTRLFDADKYASLDRQEMSPELFVRMDGLDPASAMQLILESSGIQKQSNETVQHAEQIAEALDYHPLAIVVASSLIRSNVYSIKKYAEALQDQLAQKDLLDTETEQATYRKVSATFEISATVLQELAVTDESAQHALKLLDILAFMHHQGVSEEIFVRAWEFEEEVLSNCVKQDREPQDLSMWHVAQARKYFPYATLVVRKRAFRKARAHLIRLTLMKQNPEDNTTYMHFLVHLWARERLQYVTTPWAGAASILALSAQGSGRWEPYSPQLSLHCETNYRLRDRRKGLHLQGETICRTWCNFAWQMIRTYHPHTSDIVQHFAREVRSISAPEVDVLLVTEAQLLLAVLCLRDGDVSRAVAVLEKVVGIRAKLADDHPSRLDSEHELARAYIADGRTSEAVEISEHVVKLKKEKLSDDHFSLLATRHLLARAYLEDGRVSQAIEIFEHIVRIGKKLAGAHPDRLASQHELARAYLEDGRISQATEIFEHVVHTEEQLAADDPSRLASQGMLAHAYLEDGRFSLAIEIFEHVVQTQEKLSVDHPNRLMSQLWLAEAHLEDGRISQAIEMFEHVVQTQEKLSVDHPNRLMSQLWLAKAYLEDGRISRAIEMFEHVAQTGEKLSADHPDRLASQHELACAYWHASRFAEADKLMSHVVEVSQRTLPEGHRDRTVSERVLARIREDPENPAAVSKDLTASADQEPGEADEDDMPSNL